MKYLKILMSVLAAVLMSSCQLFYNPDFNNKAAVGGSPTNGITPMSEIIGPGVTNFTGTYTSYVKGYNVYVSIDGGTSMLATMNYPAWSTGMLNLSCGPHKVSVQLEDSSGNVKDSKNFIYNVPAYVATSGSDTANKGNTPASPFKSIQQGANSLSNIIKLNGQPGYVYVAAGTYTTAGGELNPFNDSAGLYLNVDHSNINILGGWDSNFQVRNTSGTSVINMNGAASCNYAIQIANCGFSLIDGFTVENSYNTGIGFINSTNNVLTNLIISNNPGGGVYIYYSPWNIISAIIIGNVNSASDGGGISILNSHNITLNGLISNNSTQIGYNGGGISLEGGYNNTINANISFNMAVCDGGGIFIYSESNDFINSPVINNSGNQSDTANGGGGIAIEGSSFITVNGVISNNYASGGLTSVSLGGGIYLFGSHNNTITANIISNKANNNGGGICFNNEANDNITGLVSNNAGGGICITNHSINIKTNGQIITDNSPYNYINVP